MMRKLIMLFVIPLLAIACSNEQAVEPNRVAYKVDSSRLTVSGISSGGYMAGQLHLAHSDLFNGVAILAGGPFWCAEGTLTKALGPCLTGGDVAGDRLVQYARDMADAGNIDSIANVADDPVWLFHGARDAVVGESVVSAAAVFYEELGSADNLTVVRDVPVAHGMPTLSAGTDCDSMATPFLNACDYDAAGELLTALYGSMHDRTNAAGELRVIPQPGYADAEMLESAFLYVPTDCRAGAECGLHVALHGCQQSSEFVDDTFARHAGFNEWAESNQLMVLYPQVASSKLAPMNPSGCWDWWGYTNEDYATKSGPQIAVIKATIDALADSGTDPELKQIMQGLRKDSALILDGLLVDNFDTVAQAAADVADHPQIPASQVTRVAAELGTEMAAFKQFDTLVHDLSLSIRSAALEKNGDRAITDYQQMIGACLGCHASYRQRVAKALTQ